MEPEPELESLSIVEASHACDTFDHALYGNSSRFTRLSEPEPEHEEEEEEEESLLGVTRVLSCPSPALGAGPSVSGVPQVNHACDTFEHALYGNSRCERGPAGNGANEVTPARDDHGLAGDHAAVEPARQRQPAAVDLVSN